MVIQTLHSLLPTLLVLLPLLAAALVRPVGRRSERLRNTLVATATGGTLLGAAALLWMVSRYGPIVADGTTLAGGIGLAADAFGALPPISKMTPEQAMYHFLSGYTAKLAGTEKGLGNEPVATFSACFGAPFMALHPSVYAKMLGQKIAEHGVDCWLVNTGWTGGPHGVGRRMKISHTRAMVHAALDGSLRDVPTTVDPVAPSRKNAVRIVPHAVPVTSSGRTAN